MLLMFSSSSYITASKQNGMKRDEKLIFIYRRLIEITRTSIKELCGRDSRVETCLSRSEAEKSSYSRTVSQSGESGAQLDTSVSN